MKSTIRIGTRASKLAMYQSGLFERKVRELFPQVSIQIVPIRTHGDIFSDKDFSKTKTKQVFTREIEEALLGNAIDLAVHSAKDMSAESPRGLEVCAVLEREDPRDCLIAGRGKKLSNLPSCARVGTSALRRKIQLIQMRPDISAVPIRGNVDTRIQKMEAGQYNGVMLAYAGLKRLGLEGHATEIFDPKTVCPAPAQGIIAIQSRADDSEVGTLLQAVNHVESYTCFLAERAFLRKLGGNCQLPCGALSQVQGQRLHLYGVIFSEDGKKQACAECDAERNAPEKAGQWLAEKLLTSGGQAILEQLHETYKKKS